MDGITLNDLITAQLFPLQEFYSDSHMFEHSINVGLQQFLVSL